MSRVAQEALSCFGWLVRRQGSERRVGDGWLRTAHVNAESRRGSRHVVVWARVTLDGCPTYGSSVLRLIVLLVERVVLH